MIITLMQVQVFMLILARVAALLVQVPFFGDKTINRSTRMVLVISISAIIASVLPFDPRFIPESSLMMLLALGREAAIGWILGTGVRLIFAGVEAAGELMGSQMGLSVATMLNPALGSQEVITANLLRTLVVLLFLIINGHHLLLSALVKSFDAIPLGLAPVNLMTSSWHVVEMGAYIMDIALSLSGPILVVIFILDFSLGLISRVAPQVNVFNLGFQLKPPLGMFVLLVTVPFLMERITFYLSKILQELAILMSLMR
jgi:flagellar biosynthetic protein FliR